MMVGGALALLVLWGLSRAMCLSAWVQYGVDIRSCPAGTPKAGVELNATSLRRGSPGYVMIRAPLYYTTGPADQRLTTYTPRISARLFLVRGAEKTELVPEKGWEKEGDALGGQVALPKDLPDGDHVLRAEVETPLGPAAHDVPLPVYAPAKAHIITDRPLYEPGNLIQFRAVVLRARDLAPLDSRPGRFVVEDPTGQVVLEERAPAGEYGVASGDFPLDEGAPTGTWSVSYVTGDEVARTTVRVEPFTLPRFSVEAAPARPFYGVGASPVVRGAVRYASGAPVSGARLNLRWEVAGAWPPPRAWSEGDALPKAAYAEDDGHFELRLPRIPADLVGQATLRCDVEALDPTGDRVTGGFSVLLSKDPIQVSAVTELGGGLAQGFNNRVYLRVTTADGRPLPGAALQVRRAWEPGDEGQAAKTDEDGVAALQLDPGPPVNVLIPAPPVRPPPRPEPVARQSVEDMVGGDVTLADQLALDRQEGRLASCQRFVEREASPGVVLRVSSAGRVTAVKHEPEPIEECVAEVVRGFQLPAGRPRVLAVSWRLTSDLPTLEPSLEADDEEPEEVARAFERAALDARRCLPVDARSAELGRVVIWQAAPERTELAVEVTTDPEAEPSGLSAAALRCIDERMMQARLRRPHPKTAPMSLGVVRLSVAAGPRYEASHRSDTVRLGYELEVSAKVGDEALGQTKLFLDPGVVPDIRLRATPVLAAPGQEVTVQLLRGPEFSGALPERLYWQHEGRSNPMDLDPETRTARFTVPKDGQGWFDVSWGGGRALVFVKPASTLAVEVKSDRPTYAPGDTARLSLRTTTGGRGAPAAVGLIGVDETLGQLVSLPGPDAMGGLAPVPQMNAMAFNVLDAQALVEGRIRGAAAAAATVTRVGAIPEPAELDRYVEAVGGTSFDPVEGLTDGFYRALGALYGRVRRWEKEAPKGELMRPQVMASLWQDALTSVEQKDGPVEDAYGRRLTLAVLPDDLLELADPRAVVVDGTRLPEDVDNWIAWVRREAP
ncbi:MAG: hypothetical protein KC933_00530 [Myxococcales bacterium]|nr:hypothetical protein [Myxococcales bacterium]MCB9648977.1 hypothetical protein [Deltaproteobacteria bacterium]